MGRLYSGWGVQECHQQKLQILRFRKHPNFSNRSLKNDLALVMVQSQYGQGVMFSPWVVPACLSDKAWLEGQGLVSGWGLLSEQDRRLSPSLQAVMVPLKPQEECVAAYSGLTPLSDSQMCAGMAGGGRASCAGDSGGVVLYINNQ